MRLQAIHRYRLLTKLKRLLALFGLTGSAVAFGVGPSPARWFLLAGVPLVVAIAQQALP
jgi:hypothetical protein